MRLLAESGSCTGKIGYCGCGQWVTDVQRACEAILGRDLDKGAFRRQIKQARELVKVPGAFQRGSQRLRNCTVRHRDSSSKESRNSMAWQECKREWR